MARIAATGGAGARMVRILQCLAQGHSHVSVRPLASQLQLPPSTVHRLLQQLVKTGMVERADIDAYRPGQELFRMASLLMRRFDLRSLAHPLLLELWKQWQETCSLCLYAPTERAATVLDTIPSPHPVRYVLEASATLPLTWGSLGRSILAFLAPEDIDHVVQRSQRGPLSGAPAPSRTDLLKELGRIRRRGYAVYEDRARLDIAGVAAPVFGTTGSVIGCLGVTMPASRFKAKDRARLGSAVARAAGRLTTALAGN
jgi:IclR family transcriptional regulator, acetate operon repressor